MRNEYAAARVQRHVAARLYKYHIIIYEPLHFMAFCSSGHNRLLYIQNLFIYLEMRNTLDSALNIVNVSYHYRSVPLPIRIDITPKCERIMFNPHVNSK